MINAQFELIILVFDKSSAKYKIFSTDENQLIFPKQEIEQYMDIYPYLENQISNCIETKTLGHNFKLTDIVIAENLSIYHVSFIMYETKIKYGYLLPIKNSQQSALPPNAQKIISLL